MLTKWTKLKTLPKVKRDPLKYLRRAYERWLPIGGKPKFTLKPATLKDVSEIIRNLKNSHAYGRDDIDATMIKLAAHVITPAITHIINLSLGLADNSSSAGSQSGVPASSAGCQLGASSQQINGEAGQGGE